MDAFFEELGRSVLGHWKRANFAPAQFPAIARAALAERCPAKHVDLPALMRGFLFDDEQPLQTDSDFGEPELVVYSHPRFYVQLLFWLEGTTAIHQHAFSGAFHVLHGSSIHARYEFDNARPVTASLLVGDVSLKKIELLEAGRTVPIVSGRRTIHSLFHLDSPSVTVVVRTQHDPGTGPQFNFLPPHLAVDPHFNDPLTARRTQLLDVLEQVGDPAYAGLVAEMVADLDFERGFHVLRHAAGYLQRRGEWEPIVRAFGTKHGTLAAGVEATLREEGRRSDIKGLRGAIAEPEHRFFLALLMNAPTREDLLALVAQRFPDEPADAVVVRWAGELMDDSGDAVTILDAPFPETLDVGRESRPAVFLAAFRHFLKRDRRRPPALRDLSAADIGALRVAFADSPLGMLTT
jgi:hypothetical protein